jgi:hypothetical protein
MNHYLTKSDRAAADDPGSPAFKLRQVSLTDVLIAFPVIERDGWYFEITDEPMMEKLNEAFNYDARVDGAEVVEPECDVCGERFQVGSIISGFHPEEDGENGLYLDLMPECRDCDRTYRAQVFCEDHHRVFLPGDERWSQDRIQNEGRREWVTEEDIERRGVPLEEWVLTPEQELARLVKSFLPQDDSLGQLAEVGWQPFAHQVFAKSIRMALMLDGILYTFPELFDKDGYEEPEDNFYDGERLWWVKPEAWEDIYGEDRDPFGDEREVHASWVNSLNAAVEALSRIVGPVPPGVGLTRLSGSELADRDDVAIWLALIDAAGLTDKELPHTLRLLRVCWGETNGMEERENGR